MRLEDLSSGGDRHIDHLAIPLQVVESLAHIAVESSPRQQILIDVVVLVHLVQEFLVQILQIALIRSHHTVLVLILVVIAAIVYATVYTVLVIHAKVAAGD